MQAIQKLDMNEVNKDLRLKDFPLNNEIKLVITFIILKIVNLLLFEISYTLIPFFIKLSYNSPFFENYQTKI